jgi:predicted ATPase/class 3 adenylate cyclase
LDLERLGLPLGHRKKLMKAAAAHRAALEAEMPLRPAQRSIAPLGAERRQLTVLFCDIVGSTALSVRLDPEDLRAILHEFQRRCSEAITRYQGRVLRFLGDGVLACFGFPVAHEDDAERAVNAALAVQESISAMTVRAVPRIKCRIGIATSVVVVGDLVGEGSACELSLVGEAPNLAARLQQLAKPEQILVAPSTRRLLGQVFDLADLGEHRLKGFERRIRAWRVLRPSRIASRFEARRGQRLTPLIGRKPELIQLHRRFRQAKRGHGQLILVSGEAGIGKSRLIAALRHRLTEEPHCLLLFQCSSQHSTSAWYPVVRHLEEAAGITRDDPPALKLEKLAALTKRHLGEESDASMPLLATLLSLPLDGRYTLPHLTPAQRKTRMLGALLALIEARAKEEPALLIFEDVHWIDPSSLELLEWLRDRLPAWRMMAVLLFRPDFVLPWTDQPHVAAVTVNRLDRVEVGAMIAALAKDQNLSRAIVAQITAKTDGVPLFIEEMTGAVLEAQRAETSARAMLAVPETLHDSLMARLDQLAPMKAVAQVAATIGREFPLALLEKVLPLPKRDVVAAIDRLLASGLLFPTGHQANRIYAFKHALVQDEAYASMLRDERRELHMRVAEALCRDFADTAAAMPELIAHHYTEARERELAIAYWAKAGQRASERSAFAEAVTHLQTALALLAELPEGPQRNERELQLRQVLGGALIAAKGFAANETFEAFKRALELCRQFGDSPQIFSVLSGIVGFHVARGEFEQSRTIAEDLLERARRQEDSTAWLMGHRALGMSLFLIGQFAAARGELSQALELYDIRRHGALAAVFLQDLKAAGLAYLALTSILLGEIEAGLAHGRAAVAHAEELRHPHTICYALTFLAGAHAICGEANAAAAVAERAIALAGEYGFPQWLAGGSMIRGWARVQLGDIERGLAEGRRSVASLQATGALIYVHLARYFLAQSLAKAGETEEAMALVEQSLAEAAATSGRWYEADLHRLKGDLLMARGEPGAARRCFERGMAIAIRQGARHWQARAAAALTSLRRDQETATDGPAKRAPLSANGTDVAGADSQPARS